MNEDDSRMIVSGGCLTAAVSFAIGALVMALMFTSCTTTRYVTVPEVHTDTLLCYSNTRDSIHVHDSIYVNQWQTGDTIYQVRDRWHTQYVERMSHDTLYKSRTDSIPYPVEVVKEVPAELSWWQEMRLHLANIMLYTLGIVAVGWFIRKKRG